MSIQPLPAKMEVYPMRIPPGGEVTSLLQQAVSDLGLNAPFIVSCVGSVKSVILRFATDGHGKHAVSVESKFKFRSTSFPSTDDFYNTPRFQKGMRIWRYVLLLEHCQRMGFTFTVPLVMPKE